ncbi:Protein of unknown function DUF2373 [Phaffia rhodozyma]|uniref:WKF domain-containing protein n=1 Tax=Phaffia rhodozyma TaxID=264483 RepID=A0A0F7SK33_PHARH|nr:Protein of unknown function DUF2373 [Phaffia rhodozyma]
MPSKSTNLNRAQPEKRKREDAEDFSSGPTSEPATKKKLTGAEKKQASAEGQEGQDDEEASGVAEVSAASPTPTKEDIEADTTLKEGARLALVYATLYLKFNPSPIYRPISAPPKKSMKSAHPLPLDPYSAIQSGNLFQSDYTPAEAKFELTAKQYAQKKKQERLGKAKKGDGVSNERWTFNKARESWLIRRVCDDVQLPSKYFPIALAYLSSIKAPNARADLMGTAKDALKVEGEQAKRGKRVIKMLRSSASSSNN